MIGLDTNILLRYLFDDDANLSRIARQIMSALDENEPGWIAECTILEIAWVMKSKRRSARAEIAHLLERLLADEAIVVERAEILARAIQRFRTSRAGFADCVIAESASTAGCSKTLTFDEIAARDLGMELVRA